MGEIMRNGGSVLTSDEIQEMHQCMIQHNRIMGPFYELLPKHHLWCHLCEDAVEYGNPNQWATWTDESLNKVLKMCARGCHAMRFEASLLQRMEQQLGAKKCQSSESG